MLQPARLKHFLSEWNRKLTDESNMHKLLHQYRDLFLMKLFKGVEKSLSKIFEYLMHL
jgi:hypothetical protein